MKPPVPDYVARIRPYVPGKPIEEVERELGLKNSIKLASNENPLGSSPLAMKAVVAALRSAHLYPDGSAFYLKQRLSRIHSLPAEQIIIGNGSTEIVEILARTFLGRDGEGLMADATFIMYYIAVTGLNGRARQVPLTADLRHDLDAMADAVGESTRIIFLANPNNPTGTYVTRGELDAFMDRVPGDVLVVIDEAYKEYVTAPDYPDGLELLRRGRQVAVLRTFSKIYGLAGLRLGYALTTPEVHDAAERIRSPFNTNSVAQAAALAALDDEAHVTRSREHNSRELTFLAEGLAGLGIAFTPSVANFILVDTGMDAAEVYQELLRRGIIVRPMGACNLPASIRVTVGTRRENEDFLAAIRQVLCDRIPTKP